MNPFPELPIVTPDPPRKSQAEKYGGLLYLGAGGLLVLVAMIGWFGYGVWSMRDVWSDVYVLNDPKRPELDRVNAGWRLARNPNVTQRQRWDLAISKVPPDLARYLLAESLTSEAISADSRTYGLAIARSTGWPRWLRLLLVRPLAYGAAEGAAPDLGPIREMRKDADSNVALWAEFCLAVSGESGESAEAKSSLSSTASFGDPERSMAHDLLQAANSVQPARNEALDRATARLRSSDESAAGVWKGWEETPSGIVRASVR
jgi:hypothetical protein